MSKIGVALRDRGREELLEDLWDIDGKDLEKTIMNPRSVEFRKRGTIRGD